MSLSKTGKTTAIKNIKQSGIFRLSFIESNFISQQNKDKSKQMKEINQLWLKSLKKSLEEGLSETPEVLDRLNNTVFFTWGKCDFLNTFALAHVHIFKECEDVSKDLALLIEKIVFDSYKKYEESTGIKVKIIKRITVGGSLNAQSEDYW